jgi:basic membrane protein A and related proteins
MVPIIFTTRKEVSMRKIAPIATFLVLFAMLLSACGSTTTGSTTTSSGSTPTTKGSVTVALVTDTGGLNDGGYNELSNTGYTKAQTQYGFKRVVIQTNSPNDYLQNLTTAAQQADMVIAIGFNMEVALDRVARQYPTKKFAIVDGCAVADTTTYDCDNLPNVATLYFSEQQAGCLVGAIAGQMEVDGKSKVPNLLGYNTIGAVGGQAIPPVIRYIAGYKYCAEKVDPTVKFALSYSNDFSDASKCKADAESEITEQHADIVFQVAGGCGIGVLDAATEKNVYSIGVDADQGKDSSGKQRPSVITSALKRVDSAVYDIINDAETGAYAAYVAKPYTYDIAHDGVGYAPASSAVPQDAVDKANTFESQIQAGTLVPPTTIPTT